MWYARGKETNDIADDKTLKYCMFTAGSGACGKIANLYMWVVVDYTP